MQSFVRFLLKIAYITFELLTHIGDIKGLRESREKILDRVTWEEIFWWVLSPPMEEVVLPLHFKSQEENSKGTFKNLRMRSLQFRA